MVRGLQKFDEYFKDFPESYIIIGGTACDMIIDDAGLNPRATQDIDIILVVEALSPEFVKRFWEFVNDAGYQRTEKSSDERKYYRFLNTENDDYPKQIELFAREPDTLDLDDEARLTPIPVDDDVSNLSAILMDEEYYNYTIRQSTTHGNLRRANIEALICLKAKAFINMTEAKKGGEKIDDKNIKKHKLDVFRLAVLLTAEHTFELPASIAADMQTFVEMVKDDLPGPEIFKMMQAGNINVADLFTQLKQNFNTA